MSVGLLSHSLPENAQAFLAPAKLNLMLHIVGRRADGYHLLETVFCFIGLYDTVYLAPRPDGRIVLHNPLPDVLPEQDLTVRAALALQLLLLIVFGIILGIADRLGRKTRTIEEITYPHGLAIGVAQQAEHRGHVRAGVAVVRFHRAGVLPDFAAQFGELGQEPGGLGRGVGLGRR